MVVDVKVATYPTHAASKPEALNQPPIRSEIEAYFADAPDDKLDHSAISAKSMAALSNAPSPSLARPIG